MQDFQKILCTIILQLIPTLLLALVNEGLVLLGIKGIADFDNPEAVGELVYLQILLFVALSNQ